MSTLRAPRPPSLRRYLLVGILVPVLGLVALNTVSLYREALATATTAYDRTLLASAKTISEQLDVHGYDEQARFTARVPYAALEAFETDNQSRMYYKVSTLSGEMVSGYEDLPLWTGQGAACSRPTRPWWIFTMPRTATARCGWPPWCSRWPVCRGVASR